MLVELRVSECVGNLTTATGTLVFGRWDPFMNVGVVNGK